MSAPRSATNSSTTMRSRMPKPPATSFFAALRESRQDLDAWTRAGLINPLIPRSPRPVPLFDAMETPKAIYTAKSLSSLEHLRYLAPRQRTSPQASDVRSRRA